MAVKIALCSPIHDMPKAGFSYSLDRMILETARTLGKRADLERFVVRNSLITDARNRLYLDAKAWGADYLLWMDVDHVFPPDALLKLLRHKVSVVGLNFRKRTEQLMPVAFTKMGDGWQGWIPIFSNKAKADAGVLEEVDRLGLGFFLMDMKATAEAFKAGPVFEMQTTPKTVGEDSMFCDKLRAVGHKIYVDHALSMQSGHISEVTLMFPA